MSMNLKRSIVIEIDARGAVVGAKRVEDALTGIETKGKRSLSGLSDVAKKSESSISSLAVAAKGFAAAIVASQVAVFVKDVALLSARYETLGVVMNVIGKNSGYASAQMTSYQKGLEKTGISATESRNNLAKMAQANIDLAKSTQLARIAQDAAVVGNMNSSQAFEQLVFGIQSAQIEVLRTIGINVNFEQSYKKMADQLGKTSAELTEYEKTQARVNAVVAAGDGIAGTYETAMDTAGKKLSSLSRYAENAQVKLGEIFQPALIGSVDLFTAALKGVNEQLDKIVGEADNPKKIENLDRVLAGLQKRKESAERGLRQNSKVWGDDSSEADSSRREVERLDAQISRLEAAKQSLGGYAKSAVMNWAEVEKANMNAANTFISTQTQMSQVANAELKKLSMNELEKLNSEYEAYKKQGADKVLLAEWYAKEKKKIDDKLNKDSIAAAKKATEDQKRLFEELDQMQLEGRLKLTESQDKMMMRREGMEDAKKRATSYMADIQQNDLKLVTDFADKFKDIVLGETALKISQLDEQAKAFKNAGVNELALEKWLAQEKLAVSRDWQDGVKRGLIAYVDDSRNAAQIAEEAIVTGFESMEDALTEFVTTGKLSFSDLADSIISDLARIVIQQQITGPLAGAAGDLFSGLFSGGSVGPKVGYAKGGIPGAASLHAYANSIVSSPTIFPFARGVGLMGEAGPEAIMPLKRGPDGTLGVSGGGGSNVVVNVIESPGNGGQQNRRNEGGTTIIDVMVEQIEAKIAGNMARRQGPLYNANKSVFGLAGQPGAY